MWIAHWATFLEGKNKMACHYIKKDGLTFFTDKDENLDYIVYEINSYTDTNVLIDEYIKTNNFRKVIIQNNENISNNIKALEKFSELEAIRIYYTGKKNKYDCSVFNSFKKLKSLSCELENIELKLPELKTLSASYGKNVIISPECTELESVCVHRCKDFEAFWLQMKEIPSVKKIEISFCTLPDLSSICEMSSLEELHFVYTKKLEDISGIVKLKRTLKHLWFKEASAKNITNWDPLSELKELQELVIVKSSISNLHFLEKLPNLTNLRLIETKVLTNDLSPLQNIKSVSYFHTGIDKQIEKFLAKEQKQFMKNVIEHVNEIEISLKK